MTMLPDFRYIRPGNVEEAVAALAGTPGAAIIAGATDLLPNLRRGLGEPSALVDLSGVATLATVEETAEGLRIGAGVRLGALASHPVIQRDFPAIAEAAQVVAGPTHRAAATVGGNLCQDTRCYFYNQSEWWRSGNGYCLKYQGDRCHVAPKSTRCFATYRGDLAPVLMALGAEVEVAGPGGRRRLPLAGLFHDEGATYLTLAAGELLTSVTIPAAARGLVAGYEKVRIRDSIDFPLAGIAVALRRDGDRLAEIRVAITGTNSAPLTVDTAALAGQPWNDETARLLGDRLNKTAKFQTTTTVGMKYRRRVLLATARRLVQSLWEKAA
jgi:4-hydroxybenzoyl-CoA reductase subunit beta